MHPIKIKFVATKTITDEDGDRDSQTFEIMENMISEAYQQQGNMFADWVNTNLIPANKAALIEAAAADFTIDHESANGISFGFAVTGIKSNSRNINEKYKWKFEIKVDSPEYICLQAFQDDSFLCYLPGTEDPRLITIRSSFENKAIMLGFYKE